MAERGGLENRCTFWVPWVRIPPSPPNSCSLIAALAFSLYSRPHFPFRYSFFRLLPIPRALFISRVSHVIPLLLLPRICFTRVAAEVIIYCQLLRLDPIDSH